MKTNVSSSFSVLQITSRTDTGGGPQHLSDLLNELRQNKAITLYLAAPTLPPHSDNLRKMVTESIQLPSRAFSFLKLIELIKFVKKNKVQIIHSHGRGAGVYSRLAKLVLGNSIRVVHTFHGIHRDTSTKGKIKLFADKFLSPFADKYINVSSDEKSEADSLGLTQGKAIVIPNGVNLQRLEPEKLNLPTTFKRIGFYARFDYQKGYDIFYSFLVKFFEKHPNTNLKFVVAGTTASESNVPFALKSQIQFLGMVSHPLSFFGEIDLLLSCSRWEGMPIAVLESMTYQRPCLLPKVVGHTQFLESETAIGYNSQCYEDFEQALLKTNDIALLKEVATKGYQAIQKEYNTEIMATRTLKEYQNLNWE